MRRYAAEAAYAHSMFLQMLGDHAGSIASLEQLLQDVPDYAPALLSAGSVEYQRGRTEQGRKLFAALLDLPDDEDLVEILDKAGSFLIDQQAYADGLELFQRARVRFPNEPRLHQGYGCCAGHLERHADAIAASRAALALAPDDVALRSDLGWSLFQAGEIAAACTELERAVALDPTDELAASNLAVCRAELARLSSPRRRPPDPET